MTSVIYMIINIKNGKRYVGSAKDFKGRCRQHIYLLRKGAHTKHFQSAYYKYGEESLVFMIKELIKDEIQLVPREQIWLDYYKSYLPENGYNVCKIAGSSLGIIRSEETKQRISLFQKGRVSNRKGAKLSEETKQKIRDANVGKTLSKETKKKMSESRKGENNYFWGKKHSEETKKAICLSNTGKTHTEKTKEKMSKSQKGRKHTENTKQLMSLSHKRRKQKWEENQEKVARLVRS